MRHSSKVPWPPVRARVGLEPSGFSPDPLLTVRMRRNAHRLKHHHRGVVTRHATYPRMKRRPAVAQ